MKQDFYLDRLRERYALDPLVPTADDRRAVHDIIFEELCVGIIRDKSFHRNLDEIENARSQGADGVILGCTEIGLLIGAEHIDLPVFDSTLLHADAALDFVLAAEAQCAA
jgi:aspartate racemase